MRLRPLEANVDLYKQGFEDDDILDRQELSARLSALLDRVEGSTVVAVDGPWGCGKTYFLQRWVGAHEVASKGSTKTIYINAFEQDYLSDPLIAITGAIENRFSDEAQNNSTIQGLKLAAQRLSRPAARISLAAATAGASELAGATFGALVNSTVDEVKKNPNAFWQIERNKQNAVNDLKKSLIDLSNLNSDNKPERRIVIVIDELDRCRPDYALETIEVIKHFFAINGVNFIIGANLDHLAHSVSARYGNCDESRTYLTKFLDIEVNLSRLPQKPDHFGGINNRNWKILEADMRAYDVFEVHIDNILTIVRRQNALPQSSLRDVRKLAVAASLLPEYLSDNTFECQVAVYAALIIKYCARNFYSDFLSGSLSIATYQQIFSLGGPLERDLEDELKTVGEILFSPNPSDETCKRFRAAHSKRTDREVPRVRRDIHYLIRLNIELFHPSTKLE